MTDHDLGDECDCEACYMPTYADLIREQVKRGQIWLTLPPKRWDKFYEEHPNHAALWTNL